jgi:hypothetical protein
MAAGEATEPRQAEVCEREAVSQAGCPAVLARKQVRRERFDRDNAVEKRHRELWQRKVQERRRELGLRGILDVWPETRFNENDWKTGLCC